MLCCLQVVTELLCEMNGDVKGTARVANFRNVFQTGTSHNRNGTSLWIDVENGIALQSRTILSSSVSSLQRTYLSTSCLLWLHFAGPRASVCWW
jgi:hypothetical protein